MFFTKFLWGWQIFSFFLKDIIHISLWCHQFSITCTLYLVLWLIITNLNEFFFQIILTNSLKLFMLSLKLKVPVSNTQYERIFMCIYKNWFLASIDLIQFNNSFHFSFFRSFNVHGFCQLFAISVPVCQSILINFIQLFIRSCIQLVDSLVHSFNHHFVFNCFHLDSVRTCCLFWIFWPNASGCFIYWFFTS